MCFVFTSNHWTIALVFLLTQLNIKFYIQCDEMVGKVVGISITSSTLHTQYYGMMSMHKLGQQRDTRSDKYYLFQADTINLH